MWCRHGPFYPVPSLTKSQGHLSELPSQPHREASCQLGKESTQNPGVCLAAACQELQVRSVCPSASPVLEHVCIYMKSAGTPSSARGQLLAGTCALVTGHGSRGSHPVLTTAPAQCAGEIPPHQRGTSPTARRQEDRALSPPPRLLATKQAPPALTPKATSSFLSPSLPLHVDSKPPSTPLIFKGL